MLNIPFDGKFIGILKARKSSFVFLWEKLDKPEWIKAQGKNNKLTFELTLCSRVYRDRSAHTASTKAKAFNSKKAMMHVRCIGKFFYDIYRKNSSISTPYHFFSNRLWQRYPIGAIGKSPILVVTLAARKNCSRSGNDLDIYSCISQLLDQVTDDGRRRLSSAYNYDRQGIVAFV